MKSYLEIRRDKDLFEYQLEIRGFSRNEIRRILQEKKGFEIREIISDYEVLSDDADGAFSFPWRGFSMVLSMALIAVIFYIGGVDAVFKKFSVPKKVRLLRVINPHDGIEKEIDLNNDAVSHINCTKKGEILVSSKTESFVITATEKLETTVNKIPLRKRKKVLNKKLSTLPINVKVGKYKYSLFFEEEDYGSKRTKLVSRKTHNGLVVSSFEYQWSPDRVDKRYTKFACNKNICFAEPTNGLGDTSLSGSTIFKLESNSFHALQNEVKKRFLIFGTGDLQILSYNSRGKPTLSEVTPSLAPGHSVQIPLSTATPLKAATSYEHDTVLLNKNEVIVAKGPYMFIFQKRARRHESFLSVCYDSYHTLAILSEKTVF